VWPCQCDGLQPGGLKDTLRQQHATEHKWNNRPRGRRHVQVRQPIAQATTVTSPRRPLYVGSWPPAEAEAPTAPDRGPFRFSRELRSDSADVTKTSAATRAGTQISHPALGHSREALS
jgi:hypothetical protein